jgi:hypothetical protein
MAPQRSPGAGALMARLAGFTSTALAQGAPNARPLFRFGLIADPQDAPVVPRRTRLHANSPWKLAEAVEAMHGEPLAFVATLGDIIDRHWESYAHILPVHDRLKHPAYPANEHDLWRWKQLSERLAGWRSFTAFPGGHNHAGNRGKVGNDASGRKHFVNLKGMVETPDKTAFSIVAVLADRLELKGFVLEESRVLRI